MPAYRRSADSALKGAAQRKRRPYGKRAFLKGDFLVYILFNYYTNV